MREIDFNFIAVGWYLGRHLASPRASAGAMLTLLLPLHAILQRSSALLRAGLSFFRCEALSHDLRYRLRSRQTLTGSLTPSRAHTTALSFTPALTASTGQNPAPSGWRTLRILPAAPLLSTVVALCPIVAAKKPDLHLCALGPAAENAPSPMLSPVLRRAARWSAWELAMMIGIASTGADGGRHPQQTGLYHKNPMRNLIDFRTPVGRRSGGDYNRARWGVVEVPTFPARRQPKWSSCCPSNPTETRQQIIELELHRLTPVEDRLHDLRRARRVSLDGVDVRRREPLGHRQVLNVASRPRPASSASGTLAPAP